MDEAAGLPSFASVRVHSRFSNCPGMHVQNPEPDAGDEPPPPFSARCWAGIRTCLLRSSVPVGRRSLSFLLGVMSAPSDKQDYSLRNFPPDLFATLGLPVVIMAIFTSWLLSIHGNTWIWATAASFGIAVFGAALLFVAKLPLYRQRRFFTFGIQALPESSHGFYRWGCRCSIAGCMLIVFLLIGSMAWR